MIPLGRAPRPTSTPRLRRFLEELVRERPGEDIRALAARRTHEPSGEGHEKLTEAMRELL
jgi:hypothetical protein